MAPRGNDVDIVSCFQICKVPINEESSLQRLRSIRAAATLL